MLTSDIGGMKCCRRECDAARTDRRERLRVAIHALDHENARLRVEIARLLEARRKRVDERKAHEAHDAPPAPPAPPASPVPLSSERTPSTETAPCSRTPPPTPPYTEIYDSGAMSDTTDASDASDASEVEWTVVPLSA